jgi:hypothetical protein
LGTHAINVLLAIGIFANLVKGGDLLLRKHQKQRLQETFEAFTVWLDDLRPTRWFALLPRPTPAFWWSVFSSLFALNAGPRPAGGALTLQLDLIRASLGTLLTALPTPEKSLRLSLEVAMIAGCLAAIPASIITVRKIGPHLVSWLVGPGRFWPFLGRLLLFYVPSTAVLGLFWGLCWLVRGRLILTAIVLLIWPFSFVIYFLNVTGWLIVSLYLFLSLLNLLVKSMTAICWRIAEYSQGVFAALLLIATVILGIAKVALGG